MIIKIITVMPWVSKLSYWWLGLGTVIMDRYPFGNDRNPQLRPSSSFPIAMGFPNANFDDEGDEVLCECTFWCSAGALWTVCGRSPPCQQPSKKQEQYCKTFIRRGVLNSRERVNYGSRNFRRCLGQAVITVLSSYSAAKIEQIWSSKYVLKKLRTPPANWTPVFS